MNFRFSINETNNIIKIRHAFSESGVYEFPFTGKIVHFTVPTLGIYKIEAWGAGGGDKSIATGPSGAYSKSFVSLIKDESIQILVGEKGYQSYSSGLLRCAGGSGGTFIAKGNTPLCVAGGGGGFSSDDNVNSAYQSHACGQSTQLSANFGTGQASLKMGGKGGGYDAGGGGGFVGDGEDGTDWGKGGISFLNGGAKQTQRTYGPYAYGGFGGGGSRSGYCGIGAGGGGYTGGSGSHQTNSQGGGGGSYFEGNFSNEASFAISGCDYSIPQNPGTNGNGFAILTLLNSIPSNVQNKKVSHCYCNCHQNLFLWTFYATLTLQ
jgi:hypothetical protein